MAFYKYISKLWYSKRKGKIVLWGKFYYIVALPPEVTTDYSNYIPSFPVRTTSMGEKLLYNTGEPMKPLIDVGLRKRRLCVSKSYLLMTT